MHSANITGTYLWHEYLIITHNCELW